MVTAKEYIRNKLNEDWNFGQLLNDPALLKCFNNDKTSIVQIYKEVKAELEQQAPQQQTIATQQQEAKADNRITIRLTEEIIKFLQTKSKASCYIRELIESDMNKEKTNSGFASLP